MPSHALPHYLRTHRRRSGLSERQVAYLLGCASGSKVSRYERFARLPDLRTLLAYEIIFHAPAQELLAGFYDAIEFATLKRVRALADSLRHAHRTPLVTAQLTALAAARRPSACNHPKT